MFVIQDVWNLHSDKYCEECPYRQTHISYVPEGESYADYVMETCALLDDTNIPESECLAYEPWLADEKIEKELKDGN